MLLAATDRERLAGAVLNDVGPVLDPAGLELIRTYVGRSQNWPTWLHAARALAELNATVYPDYELADWLAMAKRLCRLSSGGRIVFDYDMKIRSEEHTSELPSLMRISYAVFCLKKKNILS